MISILDDASLVSCDKHVVKNSRDLRHFRRLQYVATTGVITSVSKSFDFHQTIGEDGNENETVTYISRTSPCTCKSTMIDVFDKKDNIIFAFEARKSKEHKNVSIDVQKAISKQQRPYRHSLDSRTIIVFALIDDKNESQIIITTNDVGNMVRFSTMIDDPWWKEQEPNNDQDDADLSPQMIKAITDLASIKNINIPSDVQEEFELFPKPDKALGAIERRDEKEEETSFLCDNAFAFLEEMDKVHASTQDKAKMFISDIDTKDSTEDQDAPSDSALNYCDLDNILVDNIDNEAERDEDGNSSIASSSSSAVFEFFDDVSALTDEDFIDYGNTEDIDKFNVTLYAFEDISLLSDDIQTREGKDFPVKVSSLARVDFFDNRHNNEKQDSMGEFIIAEENIIWKPLKYDILLDGFLPKDELRMA